MKNLCFKILLGVTSLLLFAASGYAQPLAATVSTTSSCGPSSGTATANATGGTGSYTYHWYPSQLSTTTINNQPAGSGSVTVWDGVDSVNIPYTIASTPAATVSITAKRDTFCLAGQDTLTANANNPTATYVWSGGTLVGTVSGNPLYVTAINSGSYTFTVTSTDINGCTATASKTLTAREVSITVIQTVQPSCNRNTGSIRVGVQPPGIRVDFYKNGTLIQSTTTPNISNLLPDTYTAVVNDPATGCSASTGNIVLVDNSSTPTFSNAVTPEQCYGDKNGSIIVTVGNCSGGCTYSWTYDATNHSDTALNLGAGTYIFAASNSGCSNVFDTIVVPGPASPLKDTLRVTPDHCGKHDGSAVVLSGGGSPPYSFVWSQGTAATPADSVSGLVGDSSVIVIVTDSHGCADTLRDSVLTTAGPTARILPSDTICRTESNGALRVQATGIQPLTYRWSSGSTTSVAGGLAPGTYAVTVTDAVGCDLVLTQAVIGYNAYIALGAPPSVYRGETAEIHVFTNVPVKNAYWSPYIDNSTGSTDVYDKPQVATTYTVTVIYGQACELHDTITVLVLEDSSKMVIPNTFTPNNDGINDVYKLIAYQTTLETFHIWIYDRWGNKVYESTDPDFNWDGTDIYNTNKPLNTAVFSYAIEYKLAHESEKRTAGGNISLIK